MAGPIAVTTVIFTTVLIQNTAAAPWGDFILMDCEERSTVPCILQCPRTMEELRQADGVGTCLASARESYPDLYKSSDLECLNAKSPLRDESCPVQYQSICQNSSPKSYLSTFEVSWPTGCHIDPPTDTQLDAEEYCPALYSPDCLQQDNPMEESGPVLSHPNCSQSDIFIAESCRVPRHSDYSQFMSMKESIPTTSFPDISQSDMFAEESRPVSCQTLHPKSEGSSCEASYPSSCLSSCQESSPLASNLVYQQVYLPTDKEFDQHQPSSCSQQRMPECSHSLQTECEEPTFQKSCYINSKANPVSCHPHSASPACDETCPEILQSYTLRGLSMNKISCPTLHQSICSKLSPDTNQFMYKKPCLARCHQTRLRPCLVSGQCCCKEDSSEQNVKITQHEELCSTPYRSASSHCCSAPFQPCLHVHCVHCKEKGITSN